MYLYLLPPLYTTYMCSNTFRSGDDSEPCADDPADVDGEGAESEDELTDDEDS
jgi:hypothetical protein